MGRLRAECPCPTPSRAWTAGLHVKSLQGGPACGGRLVASLLPTSLSGQCCHLLPGPELRASVSQRTGLSNLCRPPSPHLDKQRLRDGPRGAPQPQLRGRPDAVTSLCGSLLCGLPRQADPRFRLGPRSGRGCARPLGRGPQALRGAFSRVPRLRPNGKASTLSPPNPNPRQMQTFFKRFTAASV